MSSLINTFEKNYTNFFKFFSTKHTIKEIEDFIENNKILSQPKSSFDNIHLNMIDTQNLNILFHIVIKSDSDKECLEKLKYLIEKYDINYNGFDYIHHRKLPFYTCVKGFLESTKYLLEKMNFDINYKESDGKNLFFSAIKSYNINLLEYLDNKFPRNIFDIDQKQNTCIFNIFKKDIKNKDNIDKLKNILRYILKRGFKIDEKNSEGITFREKCTFYKIDNVLNEVINEFDNEKENKGDNNLQIKNLILNGKKEIKEEAENNMENKEKNENKGDNEFKQPNKPTKIKSKLINKDLRNDKNKNELNDFDIEMDDEFIANETKKEKNNNLFNINESGNKEINDPKKIRLNKFQNNETKKRVCAFMSKKRHNLILKEETLISLRNDINFKKYFI